MSDLAHYRQRALAALGERLAASEGYGALDDALDALLRLSAGLPGRPAARLPYEGLFPSPRPTILSPTQFAAIVGDTTTAAKFYPHLGLLSAYGIDNALRTAHFLAQAMHESANLRHMRELWGPTEVQKTYEPPGRKAEMLGNTLPGDGYRFRGGGLLQLTGRRNYAQFSAATGLPLVEEPERISEPYYAVLTAAWYWQSRNINRYADQDDLEGVTRAINGGTTGIANRSLALSRIRAIIMGPG